MRVIFPCWGSVQQSLALRTGFLYAVSPGKTREVTPVVPDYSYPFECLTFAPLPRTLIADDLALFSASSPEGLVHAIGLLSPHRLRCIALSVSRVSAPRKHGLAASAGCLSTHRYASQASAS